MIQHLKSFTSTSGTEVKKKKKNIADCDLSSPANELNAFDLFMNEDGITMSKVF